MLWNLTALPVIVEDDRTIEKQGAGITVAFKPRHRWQEWQTARFATLVIWINRAGRVERKLREWAS